eukprot:TRINITY_DN47561_c0_g1_i1.p1 TRINITY_DN47561_c0_g1~~TRINITY_DN47561_c0_g1_i1.p1  ORF type:complete len:531 (-),score=57.83 TRINITY_DN47561_c0_g1_i1:73-1665(-)
MIPAVRSLPVLCCLLRAISGASPHLGRSKVPYFGESHGYKNALDGRPLVHRGEYFEVVSPPLEVLYGQVHNKFMPTVSLPEAVVKRFQGRTMAITGFENQVIRVDEQTQEEIPVACSDLYNHHWNLYLLGSDAPFSDQDRLQEHGKHAWGEPGDEALPGLGTRHLLQGEIVPVRQVFSEGNGNEHRGSFHGTPRGYAQLLFSPATAELMHMSINTRNPAGFNLNPALGPQPRASTSRGLDPEGAPWSGILECPCTTRRKIDLVRGTIDGRKFGSNCMPGGALQKTNNSICSLDSYGGGMQCCVDGMVMLDEDQPDYQKDVYFHKLRVYFEECDPKRTLNAFRLYWQTEEWMGEYQIPQCPPGTPPESCIHTITSKFKAIDMFGGLTSPTNPNRLNCSLYKDVWCGQVEDVERSGGLFKLVYMAFHQHSPAVLSGELINADTGSLICRNVPLKGAAVGDVLNEKDYAVGIPPCVWGSAEEGLPEPPVLNLSTNLMAIAKYNNSVPHYGVMAMWQGRGGLLKNPANSDDVLV